MKEFDTKLYVDIMLKNSRKHIQIIGIFARLKGYTFDNKEQIQWFIKRNSRTAKRLDCFELNKIKTTLKYLIEQANFKVTLESVEKYILENVEELKGEQPIIILKDGEKVYDTKRIIQLESEGQVFYTGKEWQEKKS